MNIPQEFTFSIKGGQDKIVILNCDLFDMAAYISYLLHHLYSRFRKREPAMAEAFRKIITDTIVNPNSPCWSKEDAKPGETEIFFITPKSPEE